MDKFDIHLHMRLEKPAEGETSLLGYAEQMLPHLEKQGIFKGVIQAFGEGQRGLGTNEECAAICKKYPGKLFWMCAPDDCDPDSLHEKIAVWKALGAVGIGELMVNKPLNDPFYKKLFQVAQMLNLPVLFHMSPAVGHKYGVVDEPGLPLLEQCLQEFPEVAFIGHSQPFWHEISGDADPSIEARDSWGKGPVKPGGRLITLFEKYPNLYGDLSANSGGRAIMRDKAFGLSFLEQFHSRLMFGTDTLNTTQEFPLGQWLDEMASTGKLSQIAYENICHNTAEKLLNI